MEFQRSMFFTYSEVTSGDTKSAMSALPPRLSHLALPALVGPDLAQLLCRKEPRNPGGSAGSETRKQKEGGHD